MKLDLETISSASDLARPVILKFVPDCWQKFEKIYGQQVNRKQPPLIMMYGMYSHGKSTLINAILGKEAAQIGKPPTTESLDDYEWIGGNCILRDTPGIQARVQHTILADESLRQCALVAFVVESGSIEENVVWKTLARMLKQGQKVCVIINDFDECRHNPARLEPLKDKLRHHLQNAASLEDFSGNIVSETPILIVDAKQALKGKMENKKRLLEDSGLPEVENALLNLAASMDFSDIMKMLKRNLMQCIISGKQHLAREDEKPLLADAEMQLAMIKGRRDQAMYKIEQAVEEKLSSIGWELTSLLEHGGSESEIKIRLQEMVKAMIDELTPVIEKETGEAAQQIENICIEYDNLRENMLKDSNKSATALDVSLEIVNSLEWKSLLGNLNLENYAKDIAISVLQQCKKWLPELFKGIGPATMGRWAATAASALGFIASGAAIFLQIYNDYKAQQEAENRARRRAEAIRDSVRNTQEKLRQSILAAVNEIFAQSFDKLIDELSRKVNELAENVAANSNERKALLQAEALLNG